MPITALFRHGLLSLHPFELTKQLFSQLPLVNDTASIRSSYVRYKESTQKLVRWLVTTVSSITATSASGNQHSQVLTTKPKKSVGGGGGGGGGVSETSVINPKSKKGKKASEVSSPNLTGNPVISIRNFTEFAKLIANRSKHEGDVTIPQGVYSLFESVIHARKMVASFYRQLDTTSPDIEAKNLSHLNFICVLEEAFDILGGSLWRQRSAEARATAMNAGNFPNAEQVDSSSGTALHMSNRFAELEVEDRDLGVDGSDEENPSRKTRSKASALKDL